MYPANPLSLMKTAATRLTRAGDQLGAAEAISTAQALRAVTIDAAWQLFAEGDVGSIEAGKFADFVILERNPLNVAAEELAGIEVLGTWLAGRPRAS
ncbi:MAG: twin-arginine translocation pathway signal protein [Chloroflexi bacterium]|nr:MAG: twin-arginine translocation pathway signal protein [Chloroflexota bacterium]